MTIAESAASDTASDATTRVIGHWVDGAGRTSRSGRTAPVFNPATGAVQAHMALADQAEVDAAIASAVRGFEVWSGYSVAKRQGVLFAFRELLNARKAELAAIITAEHGKVLSDAMGEILRGEEVVELACGFPHLIKGAYSENASNGIDVYSIKQPLGVVGIISPFNFPAMVPMWFFPIAIAAGNAVVLKPSEKDPSAALWLARLWQEAGLPDGVFTVLQGDKLAVDGLLTSPDVQSISFVGSTPIAQYIYETASAHGKRVQAPGGAKNHMLVLPDADLDLVADQAVNAGYGAAGERCMAISVILAVEPVADELIAKIQQRIGATSDNGTINWNVRLSARYPTLEVRVFDAHLDGRSSVALAVLTRALVIAAGEGPVAVAATDAALPGEIDITDAALWHAARYGVRETLVHPHTSRLVLAGEVLKGLRAFVNPHLRDGLEHELVDELIEGALRNGTGATKQRAASAVGALAELFRDESCRGARLAVPVVPRRVFTA